MKNKKYIVVTPVYEDKEASTQLFKDLANHFHSDLYVVAVDDGSIKNPLGIEAIESAGIEGAVIKLKRNVGHQRAIAIGLGHVSEIIDDDQIVITMDSDGEDTPQSIKELIKPLSQSDIDVVVAQRKSRVETLKFKMFYVIYKFVFSLLSGRKISFGNFMAFKKKAVKRVVNMQDLGIHVAGTVLSSKLRISLCPLDRGARYAGQSKMNFVGLVLHGFKGLMVFAEDVLVRVGIASTAVASLSVLCGLFAVVLKVVGIATPGWFSVAIGILFLVFLQTGTMTLMMLMLTGVVKNRSVEPEDYQTFVDEVLYAKK
ncbi:glycosyltransferase [Vibrio diazotrophicus]|uniref:Dolichol-phosphate mannosyltransferase n=1 Tax=Vibrio diazotrophicus TaxID=685 RepID=A0ABX4WDJ8_VIBDI|nr:glycosyltransferase [Vibrio diazotrophicus]PNI00922.1 dolichol-phosphate mannosyltransferase [Vibrio diazotrophicus]